MTTWLIARGGHGKRLDSFNLDTEPSPSIQANGLYAVGHTQYWIEDIQGSAMPTMSARAKPPYQPLTMADVAAVPLTGLTHVSTFSGCGGTCLGFRLAGFRTLLANDIDAHARQCYQLNLASPIDGRDIRHLTAAAVLEQIGLAPGELDVFEGSPPCTAFSTAGRRAKGWNQTKDHAGHVQSNVEDLFYEWLRLLEGLQPRAFMAENVTGMVKGIAKGYFKDVLRKMKALGYNAAAQLLDAQWLGVPQRRGRVIFIGIRNDLHRAPRFPVPRPYFYSVRDALPWLKAATFDTRGQFRRIPEFIDDPSPAIVSHGAHHCKVQDGAFPRKWSSADKPSPAVMSGRVTNIDSNGTAAGRRKFTIDEVKRLCSFPDDYKMAGAYNHQWARMGNSVPPLMAQAIGEAVRDVLLEARAAGGEAG